MSKSNIAKRYLDIKQEEQPQIQQPEAKVNRTKKFALIAFLVPPVLMSLVSLVHVYEFFKITNSSTWSFVIAFTFELASISSLIALVVLEKIEKGALWTLFFILAGYQIIGNVHSCFVNVNDLLLTQFVRMFWMDVGLNAQRLIAIIQGAALPILSLSLLKIAVDYIDFDNWR